MIKILGFCLYFIIGIEIGFIGFIYYLNNYTVEAKRLKVYEIYDKIVANSGFGSEKMSIQIVQSTEFNAKTNGRRIIIYTGLIDKSNEHEIAFILGHEFAHKMLRHTTLSSFGLNKEESQKEEANADKLGAFLMMRAGYDICKGREFWKKLREKVGNKLGSTHPNYSYRYDELNINCD